MANFWSSLTPDQQQAFEAKARRRVFAAGARLMEEGEHADHVAVILSGLTEIRVREDGGGERVVAERGPGQLIGERAALKVSVRSATVVALQIVVALTMSTEDFAEFVSTYPAVREIVENQIHSRLREGTARSEPYQPDGRSGGLTDSWMASDRAGSRYPGSTAPRLVPLTGQTCTVVRTDLVAFGANERTDEARQIIRQASLDMMRKALGPAWDTCRCEDRGDGQLIIVPPDVPTAQVIDRLLAVLPDELRRHNRIYSQLARMQLRVAVEAGPISEDRTGVSGWPIIQASRILEALPLKQAIADHDAILGLIMSPFVYNIYTGPGTGDTAHFTEVPVRVKETRTTAWMQLTSDTGPVAPAREHREQLMLIA